MSRIVLESIQDRPVREVIMLPVKRWILVILVITGIGIAPAGYTQNFNISETIQKAGQAFVEGNYPKALKLLKKVYAVYPNANILWNMARCYEEMGNYEKALRAYRVYVGMKIPENAQKEGQRRIRLVKQKLASELEVKADEAQSNGKLQKAITLYKRVYDLIHDPVDLLKLAKLHHKTGDLTISLALLDRFLHLKIGPDEAAAARQEMATIKLELQNQRLKEAQKEVDAGHYVAALELLESGYTLRKDPAVKLEIARLLERMGEKKKAIKEYRVLMKLEPGNAFRVEAQRRIVALGGVVRPSPPPAASVHFNAKKMQMSAYITGGVGAALLVAGGVLTFLSGRDFDSLENAKRDSEGHVTGMSQARAADLEASAKLKQRLSWAMYGIGGAAIATAVVLYLTGRYTAHTKVTAIPVSGGAMVGFYKEF